MSQCQPRKKRENKVLLLPLKLTNVMNEAFDFRLHAPVFEFDAAQLVRAHYGLSVGQRHGITLNHSITFNCNFSAKVTHTGEKLTYFAFLPVILDPCVCQWTPPGLAAHKY
jgi:hypothetical protein